MLPWVKAYGVVRVLEFVFRVFKFKVGVSGAVHFFHPHMGSSPNQGPFSGLSGSFLQGFRINLKRDPNLESCHHSFPAWFVLARCFTSMLH